MSVRPFLGLGVLLAGLVVTAEQPPTGHSGRRIGKLVVTVESDGALSEEEWVSVALSPDIADDPGMRLLLEQYAE